MKVIEPKDIEKTIELADGSKVLLLEWRVPDVSIEDQERNIVKISPLGQVLWQVKAPQPLERGNSFTNIWMQDGTLLAYSWDGFEFHIDQETGDVYQKRIVK